MITLQGKPICGGIVFGRFFVFAKNTEKINQYHIDDTEREITRFNTARKRAMTEIEELHQRALMSIGQEEAMIFTIHRVMLEDEDFLGSIIGKIKEKSINAEAAVEQVCIGFEHLFEQMDDEYMRERSTDVRDVSQRIIKNLSGNTQSDINFDAPAIIAARMLTPSDTLLFEHNKILAFATEKGSYNSHAAILARKMNIPAVTELEGIMNEEYSGKNAIVDGFCGKLYIDPDENMLKKMNIV